MKDIYCLIISVLSVFVFLYLVILGGRWMFSGPIYEQGQQVSLLSSKTIVKDNQICQIVENANIAYTGEEGSSWWKTRAETMLFPVNYYYVVKTDGTQLWVNESNLVPYDPEKTYCSPIAQ